MAGHRGRDDPDGRDIRRLENMEGLVKERKGYINQTLCAKCMGDCCKRRAGAVFPQDIQGPLADGICEMLQTGNYAVDWYEGDPRADGELDCVYYIRPRHTNAREQVMDGSWGGQCVFLSDTGCILAFDRRPHECRMLEPIHTGQQYSCKSHAGGKAKAALAWIPYQSEICAAIAKARGEDE